MRAVVQLVTRAAVRAEGVITASIGPGLLVLLGVGEQDGEQDVRYLAEKLPSLRLFADSAGKTNLSLLETKGELLLVSQFTLWGDARHGRRPDFTKAAPRGLAELLYLQLAEQLAVQVPVKTGVFGAHMELELINNGPMTLLLDSGKMF